MMRLTPTHVEWSALTQRISDRGSAWLLWEDEHPGHLFGAHDDSAVLKQSVMEVEIWQRDAPFRLHTFRDDTYPSQLRSVRQVPPVVFTHGHMVDDEPGVCVVGSRVASEEGVHFTRAVARGLVANGMSVIAGLARGIDTAAHQAALDVGGRTIAVLGNGFDHVYPRENAGLQAEIASRGMLLTHFLPEYGPTRWSFPARNITMSAYALATIIAEAGEKSGTRIQAREAIAHGRPVILSSRVVQATTWGRAMQNQPGVHVVDSPQEAVEHAIRLNNDRATLTRLLDHR
ncbi:DNA processing protein DprA [Nocardia nova]|uniref:DNA processing protein DprA n=1 Tax=Nocardia nova TaxID=37330 RepID=A0A2S6AMG3_9NOCA|nr:DNA-processing protein DprA [Nocardia nova]PPJ36383.1 DNA processing protein DprA [Nocardia nova]